MRTPSAGSPPAAGDQAALPAAVRVDAAEVAIWPGGQAIAPLSGAADGDHDIRRPR